jgi:hypothetical protein
MPRENAMATPEAIRIEDEVWQEAFTRREPARPSRERSLRAIDGELPDWLVETTGKTLSEPASWSVGRPATRERAASRRTAAGSAPSATAVNTPVLAGSEDMGAAAAAASVIADEMRPVPRAVAEQLTAAPPSPALLGAGAVQAGATPARRTVKIQGRGAERNLPLPDSSRRRPPRRAYERTGFRPDRLAMWAVVLGLLLVVIAIISAH